MASAADEARRATRDGLVHETLELVEVGVGDRGADVNLPAFLLVFESIAHSQQLDPSSQHLDETVVDAAAGDDALDSDAVLPRALEDAAHDDARDLVEVARVVEDDGCILAAQLHANRNQVVCCCRRYQATDPAGTDEGEVSDARMRRQIRRCIRPADDRLDQVRRVTACLERRTSNLDEEPGRPGRLLGALDDDRVAGK